MTPRHLFECWDDVEKGLQSGERLAVFSDFDGTLAPIRHRATEVVLPAGTRKALERLAERGHLVGVISGRQLQDVRERVGIGRIWYVGEHGAFVYSPDGCTLTLTRSTDRRGIREAEQWLADSLDAYRDLDIEPKLTAIAVHYRGASTHARRAASAAVEQVLERDPSLRVLPGKEVWEIVPANGASKWQALRLILHTEDWPDSSAHDRAVYIGDDVTDELAFREWPGISVVVGYPARTAARFYLRTPVEVRSFLERLD
jgi:trehalose-phosphatase